MRKMGHRERLILSGLFLSKFDKEGLEYLGFGSFAEAYNGMGYALGGNPASIKNYMQEFDPVFPNSRLGRHRRPMRDHCREILEEFGKLEIKDFAAALRVFLENKEIPDGMSDLLEFSGDHFENSSLSKRLVTGIAAERFFESKFGTLSEFAGCRLENVTQFGCGFDYRIQLTDSTPFLAAEVKGLSGEGGGIVLTDKEHRVAEYLGERYFLCLVSNFAKVPRLTIFPAPLTCGLVFRKERNSRIVTTWHATVSAERASG